MLQVREIYKRLGGHDVLEGVSFTCGAGETVVVMGRNGAGKTTLLRVVTRMFPPDRASVHICGNSMAGDGVQARRCLGYVADSHRERWCCTQSAIRCRSKCTALIHSVWHRAAHQCHRWSNS